MPLAETAGGLAGPGPSHPSTGPCDSFPYDVVIQGSETPVRHYAAFYDLASKILEHHFCCIHSIAQTSPQGQPKFKGKDSSSQKHLQPFFNLPLQNSGKSITHLYPSL